VTVSTRSVERRQREIARIQKTHIGETMTSLCVSPNRGLVSSIDESRSTVLGDAERCLDTTPLSPAVDDAAFGQAKTEETWSRTREVRSGDSSNGIHRGLLPPPEWASVLPQLTERARLAVHPRSRQQTLASALCGGIETWTNPPGCVRDGLRPVELGSLPAIYFQLGLAGLAHVQIQGQEAQEIRPGRALVTTDPSRHRCFLPRESPGWTFAWLEIHHPYLTDRIASQVATTGPVLDVRPQGALAAAALRLVSGAIKQDFHDAFEAELAMFEFVLAFERWAEQSRSQDFQGERLMEEVRARIFARLPSSINVPLLAAEFGMTRSNFSHYFRARTGSTPARFATEVRIDTAARMLLDTDQPLKTIAGACGFANANHFCRVFRRLRHLSPASFRQANR
jgi:AraC-like DNA-binding protein